jgi:3-oxoacyl-[acyl-carrier-protein] synthase II
MRRVVVTGMGAVSPLGCGVAFNWEALTASRSGIKRIVDFPVDGLSSQIAGSVPRGDEPGGFNPESILSGKELRRNDPFIHYALSAANEALNEAGWHPEEESDRAATGVIIGSGIGGFKTIVDGAVQFAAKGKEGLPPFFIPAQLINLASGQIAIRYGFYGPDYSVVGACATGAEAIASGARSILLEEADVMVVGGADATVHPLAIAGFEKLHALSTGWNDRPEEASRPFDRGRDGFVVGEGGGVLVLEERGHALKRGATIIAELAGFASASDGYHVAASHPEGLGEQRALRGALARAKMNPEEIDYLNAHATSTPVGDKGELSAIRAVFGQQTSLAISSTKSATGHTLGAAGAVEAIFSICAVRSGVVPPTLNLEEVDEGYESMNLVPNTAQEREVRVALSNAFGFGATKVALIFRRPD